MTPNNVMSGLFGRTMLAFQSFVLSQALFGKIQSELSTTLKLSLRPTGHIIGTVAFTFFHKLQPRLDAKRNRRWRRLKTEPAATRRLEIITKHCLHSLFVPSVKRYSHSKIASKYHNHASAYSLQTDNCRFIHLHEQNENVADTDNWIGLPRCEFFSNEFPRGHYLVWLVRVKG